MKIFVESISREVVRMYSDSLVLGVANTSEYDVHFIMEVDGSFIESNISFRHDGDLSFTEAEKLIKEKLSKDGGQ